jgi:hypothetical protein
MLMLVFLIGMGSAVFAQPVFENNTPAGFVVSDSTTTAVEAVKHKTVPASAWDKVDAAGWEQDNAGNGATVGSFVSGTGVTASTDNFGLDHLVITAGAGTSFFSVTQDHCSTSFRRWWWTASGHPIASIRCGSTPTPPPTRLCTPTRTSPTTSTPTTA